MIHKHKPSLIACLFSLAIFSVTIPSHAIQIIIEDSLTDTDTDDRGTISVIARSVDVHFTDTTEQSETTEESIKTVKPIQIQDLSSELYSGVNCDSFYKDFPTILGLYIKFYDIQNDNDAQAVIESIKYLHKNSDQVWRSSPYYTSLKAEATGADKNILETNVNEYIEKKRNKVHKKIMQEAVEENGSSGEES